MTTTLILGGQRSGKSEYAEIYAESLGTSGLYIATASPHDDEMTERVRLHRERRGSFWSTQEEPLNLNQILSDQMAPDQVILIECMTLWLSNLMMAERDIAMESQSLLDALERSVCPVVLVSNEVGLGIIPDNPLARQFADHAGKLNQLLARAAGTVALIVAGLPLVLKGKLAP